MLLALEGLSVGDAFGERFFGTEPALRAPRAEKRVPPDDGGRPWRWTDDTAMSVSVVEELWTHERIIEASLAARFAASYRLEPDRGYGRMAHEILGELAAGVPWQEAAARPFGGTGSKGNGGAMRAAPIGVFFEDVGVVVDEAIKSALPTHRHPEGIAGAVAIAIAAWSLAQDGHDDDMVWSDCILGTPAGKVSENLRAARALPSSSSAEQAAAIVGSGRAVLAEDTVGFCVWSALRGRSLGFEVALYETVRGMGDIDTNCAIVGGLLAVPLGTGSIPSTWRAKREPLPRSVRALEVAS
ncbi:MAG: ADP-ribosylglycohydrolase family protein [Deltaproteobacteria bacterium]|nr:ADP-ribosylglycohydrolase family protein [Deltaproteobacteria bacterium]